ncbi:DUF6461 domain-containing protein [Streptosporangium sp. NPDC049078]|uniref:DUF6461 domain-containing protein n=1 Tax=Streptosporangium sp. NPDC049078 TaxID=3155767 RepID=UPI0034446A2F
MDSQERQWFTSDEYNDYWVNGFCLTFVAGKPGSHVQEILHTSIGALIESADEGKPFLATIFDVTGGSIILERGGYAGSMRRVSRALSDDTRLALVVNPFIGHPKFAYLENTDLICAFRLEDPEFRWGSSPDFVLSDLTSAGVLPVQEPDWESEEDELELEQLDLQNAVNRVLGAISIAERATGLLFGRQLINSTQYFVSFQDIYSSTAGKPEEYLI